MEIDNRYNATNGLTGNSMGQYEDNNGNQIDIGWPYREFVQVLRVRVPGSVD
jgi:hypothetical protein